MTGTLDYACTHYIAIAILGPSHASEAQNRPKKRGIPSIVITDLSVPTLEPVPVKAAGIAAAVAAAGAEWLVPFVVTVITHIAEVVV